MWRAFDELTNLLLLLFLLPKLVFSIDVVFGLNFSLFGAHKAMQWCQMNAVHNGNCSLLVDFKSRKRNTFSSMAIVAICLGSGRSANDSSISDYILVRFKQPMAKTSLFSSIYIGNSTLNLKLWKFKLTMFYLIDLVASTIGFNEVEKLFCIFCLCFQEVKKLWNETKRKKFLN